MSSEPTDPSLIPWYRQFWPWFIIAIPALSVIGGFVTLWLALTHPETLVIDEGEYHKVRGELRAQDHPVKSDHEGLDGQP
jgi:hypothetical protein